MDIEQLYNKMEELERKVEELENKVEHLEMIQGKQAAASQPLSSMRTSYRKVSGEYKKKQEASHRLTETSLGKYALPVLATILILSGLGVLSYMTWDLIPDMGKSVLILLLAGCFAGIGIISGKKGYHVFSHALIGLSFAAVYLDLIIMHWIWNIMSLPVTFLGIAVWCIVGAWLAQKQKDRFYYLIVFTGLLVSTGVSYKILSSNLDLSATVLLLVLMAGYLALSWMYQKEYQEHRLLVGLTGALMFLVMSEFYLSAYLDMMYRPLPLINDTRPVYAMCMRILIMVFGLVLYFKKKWIWENEKTPWDKCLFAGILSIGYLIMGFAAKDMVLEWIPLTLILFSLVYETEGVVSSLVASVCMMLMGDWLTPGIQCFYLILVILAAYLLGTGYLIKKEKKQYHLISFILNLYGTFRLFFFSHTLLNQEEWMSAFLMGALMIVIDMIILYDQFTEKDRWKLSIASSLLYIQFRALGYIASLVLSDRYTWYKLNHDVYAYYIALSVLIYLFLSLVRKKMCKVPFTWWDKIHAILIDLYLMAMLYMYEKNILAVALLIHLGFLIYWILDLFHHQSVLYEIGCSLLLTWNLTVLYQYSPLGDIAILYSIFLMFFASGCVLLGYFLRRKPFRMYGLVLIFLSVAKMILVDIQGQSSMVKVAALISGGILCMVISYGYNRMEKGILKGENSFVEKSGTDAQ